MRIFVDSDILLDYLQDREHRTAAFELFAKIDTSPGPDGYTTSDVIGNVYYIARKTLSRERAVSVMKGLRKLLNIIPVTDAIIDQALESEFSDIEDAIQYFAALSYRIDVIVTRNISDYRLSAIQVMNAGKFLSLYS